jgi:hypothetical protein
VLDDFLGILSPGVDRQAAISDTGEDGWLRYIVSVISRLADDIFLYQVAQGGKIQLFLRPSALEIRKPSDSCVNQNAKNNHIANKPYSPS